MDERCPKCDARFPADRAWVEKTWSGQWSPASSPDDMDPHVRCPACQMVYRPGHPILGIAPDIWKTMMGAVGVVYAIFVLIEYLR